MMTISRQLKLGAFIALAVAQLALTSAVRAQPPAAVPELKTQLLTTPVRASRTWSSALAPNARGGWNFITQSYEYKSGTATEFVVVDLATGKSTSTEGPAAIYTNSNYQIDGQVRAPNGRIFFAGLDNYMFYYDPVDEKVKTIGKVIDPPGDNKFIFRVVFGPDGKLYGATQSNKLPTVFQLDPETLQHKVIGTVGKNQLSYSYGYYMAADPPWIYVAVGQSPWELAAINIETGESKILAERSEGAWMELNTLPEGIRAGLLSGRGTPQAKKEFFWCADGQLYPYPADGRYDPATLPFKPRNVKPVANSIVNPPEINTTALNPDATGTGRVLWRPAGTKEAWREVPFKVQHTMPVDIESLIGLPDGTLLGNAKQYHGFFRYNPADRSTKFYGAHGPSRGPRTLVNGQVYMVGYPKSVLYTYDPAAPWTSNTLVDNEPVPPANTNPRRLGNFTGSGAHYAYFLEPSRNGRLYYAGRLERDGIGAGVGSYDPATSTFAGHHENLSFFDPSGLLVMDNLKQVVFSGRLHDDPALPGKTPAEAPLIVYDYDLKEVARLAVKPGLRATGQLFATREPNIIVGLIASEKAVYRYDLAARKLLDWKELPGPIGAVTQRAADLSLWVMLGENLTRFDTTTLDFKTIGKPLDIPLGIDILAWQGDALYATSHADVRQIALAP